MRCVSWAARPFADSNVALAPVAISDAEPGLAAELVAGFTATGYSARVCAADDVRAGELAVLTEGLVASDMIARHWHVLDLCRSLRSRASRMVLLERAQAGTVDGLSGLQGLSRTLQQEWPDVDISTVSMGSNTSAIHVVSAVGGGVGDVRLSGESVDVQIVGGRPRLVPQTAVSGHVWLVSGGARGVTAACIIELARRQPGSVFVLAGRSGREPWPDDLPHAADLKSLRAALIAAAKSPSNSAV